MNWQRGRHTQKKTRAKFTSPVGLNDHINRRKEENKSIKGKRIKDKSEGVKRGVSFYLQMKFCAV